MWQWSVLSESDTKRTTGQSLGQQIKPTIKCSYSHRFEHQQRKGHRYGFNFSWLQWFIQNIIYHYQTLYLSSVYHSWSWYRRLNFLPFCLKIDEGPIVQAGLALTEAQSGAPLPSYIWHRIMQRGCWAWLGSMEINSQLSLWSYDPVNVSVIQLHQSLMVLGSESIAIQPMTYLFIIFWAAIYKIGLKWWF